MAITAFDTVKADMDRATEEMRRVLAEQFFATDPLFRHIAPPPRPWYQRWHPLARSRRYLTQLGRALRGIEPDPCDCDDY